ncbi:hypothetical protein ZHAS_00012163 [Anopheles sinensis]|uniref:Uncharacterized protein n=1 Tax=Anopheles sinensis TaxID=74873 RepID=A0A084W250_ANOSI|nr:hypothetical protein ZHAS_00012163 [Anopheles sinensis]
MQTQIDNRHWVANRACNEPHSSRIDCICLTMTKDGHHRGAPGRKMSGSDGFAIVASVVCQSG